MNGWVIKDIREALGHDPNDKNHDEEILAMSPDRQFELYCQWNGLLNWSSTLKNAVFEIYKEKK